MMYGNGTTIDTVKNLTQVTETVQSFTGLALTAGKTNYIVAANVKVYKRDNSVYTYETLSDAVTAYQSGKTVEYYIDKSVATGGQVRVIIYEE